MLIIFFRKDVHNIVDSNLPEVMAGLEMLTVNANLSPSEKKQRLRKRIPATESNENLNRRYNNIYNTIS